MFTSAIKKQTSVFCSISLNPYMVSQTWIHGEKNEKKSNSIVLTYIADVSCLTNRSFSAKCTEKIRNF